MKKSILLRYLAGVLIVTGSLVFLSSSPKKKVEPSCCKKNMKECPVKKTNTVSPGNMVLETFTHQFVMISPFRH